MTYFKAVKTPRNTYAMWEEQGNGKAVIVCQADGQPSQALMINKSVKPKQALVPVKKNRIIMVGEHCENSDVIMIYRVLYAFSNKNGQPMVKAEPINIFKNNKWISALPSSFRPIVELMHNKLNNKEDVVTATAPVFLDARKSEKGYAVMEEECGPVSTIVCYPDGTPAKSIYVHQKARGVCGKQAVIPVFPRYKILRGTRVDDGYEIVLYSILHTFTGKDGKQLEVKMLNKCVNGKWKYSIDLHLRPLVETLIDKLEGTDTETVVSKMH